VRSLAFRESRLKRRRFKALLILKDVRSANLYRQREASKHQSPDCTCQTRALPHMQGLQVTPREARDQESNVGRAECE